MYSDTLLTPVSDDAPCGPDLEASDDDAFLEYYFEALARLPERYFNERTGEAFDPKSVDLKAESAQISALLDRSRDIRLLALEAQFQILAGKIAGFADCVKTIAALLKEYPGDVNPRTEEDETDRRNAIELLDSRATVVVPLERAPLIRDRRLDTISYHDYAVASGAQPPREDETPGDSSTMLSALKSADNAQAVDEVYAQLADCAEAIRTIKSACVTAERNPFGPSLDELEGGLSRIIGLLVEVRPDLALSDAAAEGEAAPGDGEAATEEGEPGASPAPATAAAVSGPIADHAAAGAALKAAEDYFAHREPSSPALFLLRQSRALIGRPLVEAMQLLLPEMAPRARIDFGAETGFVIAMDRMVQLSSLEQTAPPADGTPAEIPNIETRDQAAALMSAVEGFFRQVEPSSPIPVLLFKAKTYLSRDFSTILADLIPAKPTQ